MSEYKVKTTGSGLRPHPTVGKPMIYHLFNYLESLYILLCRPFSVMFSLSPKTPAPKSPAQKSAVLSSSSQEISTMETLLGLLAIKNIQYKSSVYK